MWLIAKYQPTALFTLKPANATSSGGKTLLVPTPFALKMALLDAAIRTRGLEWAKDKKNFAGIRDLRVAASVPPRAVVSRTFTRILRVKEIKSKATEKPRLIAQAKAEGNWPYQKTIAYREYVQFDDALLLAFESPKNALAAETLTALLMQINYLGKRGGFVQLLTAPCVEVELPDDYTLLNSEQLQPFNSRGLLQMLDDCGAKMTFEHADIYSKKRITLGKQRVLNHVVLPYELIRSSKGFSYYERIDS